jgi:hypothetical protein
MAHIEPAEEENKITKIDKMEKQKTKQHLEYFLSA